MAAISHKITVDIVAKTNIDKTVEAAKGKLRELDSLEGESRQSLSSFGPGATFTTMDRPRRSGGGGGGGSGGGGRGGLSPSDQALRAEMRQDRFEDQAARYQLNNLLGQGVDKFLMVGALVDVLGRQVANAATKLAELTKEYQEHKLTLGEFWDKAAGQMPIVGGFWEAGRQGRGMWNLNERLTDLLHNAGLSPAWEWFGAERQDSREKMLQDIASAESGTAANERRTKLMADIQKTAEALAQGAETGVEKAQRELEEFNRKVQNLAESGEGVREGPTITAARAALEKRIADAQTKAQKEIEDNFAAIVNATAETRDKLAVDAAKLQGDLLGAAELEAARVYTKTLSDIDKALAERKAALEELGADPHLVAQAEAETQAQRELAALARDQAMAQAQAEDTKRRAEQEQQRRERSESIEELVADDAEGRRDFYRERHAAPTGDFAAQQVDAGSSGLAALTRDQQNLQATTTRTLESLAQLVKESKDVNKALTAALERLRDDEA